METSILIAKLIGLIYLVIGLGLVFNQRYYHKMFDELLNDAPLTYISGLFSLITGFLLVTFHNIWANNWTVVITVFGWLAFGKGILLLVFPVIMKKICKSLFKTSNVFLADGLIVLILGLVFAYFGFIV
jgi:uncharacterized protein YjeT (DUF2065 family)